MGSEEEKEQRIFNNSGPSHLEIKKKFKNNKQRTVKALKVSRHFRIKKYYKRKPGCCGGRRKFFGMGKGCNRFGRCGPKKLKTLVPYNSEKKILKFNKINTKINTEITTKVNTKIK